MKEHIDEMAKVLIDYTKKNHIMASHVILEDYAEQLYNADYRKQVEGEWVENEDDFWILCSVCGIELWDEQDDKKTPYCPFCGAKMNGIKKEFNHGGFESQALN